jgi:YD repeat-containing protein
MNVTVETAYNADGNVSSITAKNASTGDQVTQYVYGTTLSDSALASSLLKRKEIYPDSSGDSDAIFFEYNRQSQVTKQTDQGGTVHEYDYDKLGRQTHDRVTALDTGVDGAVRRLSTDYEVRGMRETITSWNNAAVTSGDIVNQVQFTYNDFAQLTADYQSHSGAVNTSTTPKVQYGYANGSANTIRPTTLTYPDGRVLTYDYGSTDSMSDALSRIASIVDDDAGSTHLADYSYLGLSTFVETDYTEPDIKYTLVGTAGGNDPDTGDIYRGLDRFGRIKDSYWYDYGSASDVDRIKYGYDRAGNRLWRENVVARSLSKEFDELYEYDAVHRLKDMSRGMLNSGHTALTSTRFAQCWGLDETGNWSNFREDDDGNGSWDLNQNRTANKVNEITDVTESTGPSWVTPAYSAAGNMTTVPKPADPTASFTATYDAWNRLVKLVETSSSDTVAEYQYDAAKRRVVQKSYTGGSLDETRHLFYTEPSKWQVVEEHVDSSTDPERKFVWGLRYIDDLVLRDRDTTGNGTLDERLYALQDANWNATSTIDSSGTVQRRMTYPAYGMAQFLTSGFANATNSENWETLYGGYRYDNHIAQYSSRNRELNAVLGNWTMRDPLGIEVRRTSLQEYALSRPIIYLDPSGLDGIRFQFAAFIGGWRGTWLPEPGAIGLVEFKGDSRGFGASGSSRIRSTGFIDSCNIGSFRNPPIGVNVVGASHRRIQDGVTLTGAPTFRHESATASLDVDTVSTKVTFPCYSRIAFSASAGYPFVVVAPNIDYNVQFHFHALADRVNVQVNGKHDAFPDYEVVVDGTVIYSYTSPYSGPSPWNLGGGPEVPFVWTVVLAKKTHCLCGGTCR